MELETYHWITIALCSLLVIMMMLSQESVLAPDRDAGAIKFIYEQCMNETSINITYSTGDIHLVKENDICLLRAGGI